MGREAACTTQNSRRYDPKNSCGIEPDGEVVVIEKELVWVLFLLVKALPLAVAVAVAVAVMRHRALRSCVIDSRK